ncbi:MAG: ABC-2 type transport system ATP-binding protein [Pseudoalteromonas tetraodonis]|jgi:ABC-2 type transport system ATP-binding protein
MIHAENLTKRYVGRTAVDHISFEVGRGEVVGFLGPNGAGKTTTIRMLTGYFPPSSGRASIGGFDVFQDSLQARRCIGYMPENVPLYTDMRVREYLNFRAALKGLSGRELRKNVGEVMEMCGLNEMRKKIIGNLSKGYRQRVGLADALVHKPELLILDEPTNGLDPNQIRRVRNLIKQLGLTHTILLSTHILSEVELVCDRVIILDRGKVCACETPQNLIGKLRTAGTVHVELKVKPSVAMPKLENIPGVRKVINEDQAGDGYSLFTIRVESGTDIREDLGKLAQESNWALRELHRETATLEDVFVDLTQNEHSAA